MRMRIIVSAVVVCLGVMGLRAPAQGGDGDKLIPPATAASMAKVLVDQLAETADQLAGAPLAVKPDVTKAYGIYNPEHGAGVLVVPAEGLKDVQKTGEDGTPVGYVFPVAARGVELSSIQLFTPGGKRYTGGKRLFLTWQLPGTDERREVEVLRLRRKAGGVGPGQLLVFTMGKAPALTLPLRKQEGNSGVPLSVGFRVVSKTRGALVITLHDKYAADIVFGTE
jgi:hypothetical protein